MNEQLILLAIGAVVAVIILRPLLRGKARGTGQPPVESMAPRATSDELAELELDRAMGRVSEDDYARWREELTPDAPAGTADKPEPQPDDARARAEALVRRWREIPKTSCPNCGERPEPQARFCSNCGTSLVADA
jgi:hypothetical protein